jgi:hypothetical protein
VTINRGDNVHHTFDNVPVGNVVVAVTCYDQQNAAGNVVALATQTVTVNMNQTTGVNLITDRLAEFIRIVDVPAPAGDPTPELGPLTMEPQDTKAIQAKGYDYDGNQCMNVACQWSSAEKASLGMSATTGSQITLTPTEDGEFEVTCTDTKSGQKDTLDVTVQSRIANSVQINPTEMELYRYGAPDQMQIGTTVLDGADQPISYATVSYQTDDASVATVDANGVVTVQGPGQCKISVSGHTATTTTDPTATCNVVVFDTGGVDVIVE